MRIRVQLVGASILLAGLVPALLGQTPSASAPPPSAAGQLAPVRTSGTLPDQTAANPPEVTFRDGLLSIHANNSTLGDVLKAVQNATGASVDSPGFASERVYVNLGPGSARDILASLLNGSHYDYILLGSQQQPNSVARVMLSMRQNSHEQPTTAAAASQPAPPSPPANNDESNIPEVTPDRSREVTEPQRNPAAPNQPGQPSYGQPPAANAPGMGQPPNGQQPKTPEQLLRDLQQMQQQQQQQLQLQQQLQQQNNFSR